MSQSLQEAFEKAVEVRAKAYCPFSKYQVGAVVKVKDVDELFVGCNVENSSYGATICAERGAISQMISQVGHCEIEYLLLVTDNDPVIPPCGMCLQVISEFATNETAIHLCNLKGVQKKLLFGEFLPQRFDASAL